MGAIHQPIYYATRVPHLKLGDFGQSGVFLCPSGAHKTVPFCPRGELLGIAPEFGGNIAFATMRRFRYCPPVIRLLYTIMYSLGFVLLSPLFLYKMWKRGKYRENFWQRFGCYSADLRERLAPRKEQRCRMQEVSVGEVNVALLFIGALQRKFPNLRIIVTTTTSTGYALAYERLPEEVELLYFPQDFPWSVRRAYNLIRPDFIVLMESELLPNHIWMASRRGVPLFLVNGRMSLRSEQRYKRLGALASEVFNNLSLVCAQSPEDAARERLLKTS